MAKYDLPVWYVTIRLNFDDPIVGAYANEEQAIRRAKWLAKLSNEKLHAVCRKHLDTWDVTGLTEAGIQVYRMYGSKKQKEILRIEPAFAIREREEAEARRKAEVEATEKAEASKKGKKATKKKRKKKG